MSSSIPPGKPHWLHTLSSKGFAQIVAAICTAASIGTPSGLWLWNRYQDLLDADTLQDQHVAANTTADAIQADAVQRQFTQFRKALVDVNRQLLIHEAIANKQPVKDVVDEYDRLVSDWEKHLPQCEVAGQCCLPEDAVTSALSQRYHNNR